MQKPTLSIHGQDFTSTCSHTWLSALFSLIASDVILVHIHRWCIQVRILSCGLEGEIFESLKDIVAFVLRVRKHIYMSTFGIMK